MQRYFVSEKENDIVTLDSGDTYHVNVVMRMNIDDEVEIVFNNKLYNGVIIEKEPKVKCKLLKEIELTNNNLPEIVIAQALVKEQKMDYILQKCTELGVSEIIPLITERSIVKIDKNEEKKLDRWRKIVKEASEQSKRCDIPKINNVMTLKELIDTKFTHKYVCSVNEKDKMIKSVLSKASIRDKIIFVIGSEGGISEKEEELLVSSGFERVSFGDRVLRCETASLFILSAVNYEFMR